MGSDHHHRDDPRGHHQLLTALALTAGVMLVELVASVFSGSLALMADAGHMLTDAAALGLSFFASWIATKPATQEKTFGYYRTEILAALINGVMLWLLVIFVGLHALQRMREPAIIQTGPMFAAAVLGLAVNLLNAWILRGIGGPNLNVESARLHVLSDALGSLAVIIAAVIIRLKGWALADPVASLVIALMIALSSWRLVAQSVNILLEGAPAHISVADIDTLIRTVPGVHQVHDVHVWSISTGLEAMSGHVVVDDQADAPSILSTLRRQLRQRFNIRHTTIQLEPCTRPCELASTHRHA
jgi:cobalt-zinc-cadmium efflux system protein